MGAARQGAAMASGDDRQGRAGAVRVSRLPVDTGPAGWSEILGEGPSRPGASGAVTTDWLVIGAGFAGLSAARRLAQLCNGERITVIEAGRVAGGPAGRNSGFMIDLPHDLGGHGYAGASGRDRVQTELNRRAQTFAVEAAAQYGMPDEAVARTGRINGAISARGEAHNARYAGKLGAIGETFGWLSGADMRDITGSAAYRSGLFLPGAVMLQPALYIRELARGLAGVGGRPATGEKWPVRIHENSPAVSFERQGSGWLVRTPEARISTGRVVMAVNGHAESFGFYRRRLMHVFTYASMTQPLDAAQRRRLGGESHWALTPADPMGSTVRRHEGIGGARIVIRNRWTFDPSMEVDQARVDAIARDHARAFARRFPMLGDVDMAHSWAGRVCMSRNAVSAFGEVAPGFFSACCQNGLGTARGTLAGMAAAELATGTPSDIADEMLGQAAPSRLPAEPIASLGARAVIGLREWLAGAEI